MKQITVMVDENTHHVLSETAEKEDRTLGKQTARVLRQWADEQPASKAEDEDQF